MIKYHIFCIIYIQDTASTSEQPQNNYRKFAETHDNRIEEDATQRQLACYERLLNLESDARVIDVACGFGRHTVPLAGAYREVVGLDHDQYLLGRGQQAATEQGAQNVRFYSK